jgi:hypothetical protein
LRASKKAKFGWGQILSFCTNEHLKIQNLAKSCEALAKQEKEQKIKKFSRGGNIKFYYESLIKKTGFVSCL